MKSKLLKATLLATAALAMGAMATSTQAKTYKYTFGTTYGGEYCDGMTVSSTDKVTYSGNHTGSCEGTAQYAGGFATKIKGSGSLIDISTTDIGLPGYAITFLLDTKGMAWYLYLNEGGGFELLNEGPLVKGAPPVSKHGAKSSVFHNPKAVDKPF